MKATDTIYYEYDPGSLILNIKKNGKPFGGFRGQQAEVQFQRLLESGADIKLSDMSNSIKSARVRRLRAIWIKLGIDQYRDAILESYDVTSTADLSVQQLDELIDRYNNQAPASEHVRRQRAVLLTLLNKLGIYTTNGDWKAVNAFLMQPRIAGKLMFNMSSDEMNVLEKKLRSILTKKEVQDAEINRQKLLN
jgi:hypothetical protein